MFLSLPQYEFPFPPDLDHPGSKHWSMVELTLHMPWFLLSVELVDAESPEFKLIRTICVASSQDLAGLLGSLDKTSVVGVVCMMPAWQSPNGQWTSREVKEVWMHSSDAGRGVVLLDADGQEFDCGLAPNHEHPVIKELVLRVAPARPHTHQPAQREVPPSANRRSRRARVRKAGP